MAMAKQQRWKKRWGLRLGCVEEGWLTNLRFADDILITGRSLHQVKQMLKDLVEEAGKVGLEIHPLRTKILNNGFGQFQATESVDVLGMQVEVLKRHESTMYLGRLLNLTHKTPNLLTGHERLGQNMLSTVGAY